MPLTPSVLAPAKINLDLRILGRRADGYHDLDSRVVFACLGDRLALTAGPGTLRIDGPFADAVEADGGNLVLKAANAFAAHLGRSLDAGFQLTKNLPVAAGLGGGSSDAAAALRLLAGHWAWEGDLVGLAAGLGADVPVCLGRTATRMAGIGDILSPLDQTERARLSGRPVLLVNPGVPVPTAAVFAALAQGPGQGGPSGLTLTENDLLDAALDIQPVIADVLTALGGCDGAQTVGLSGSGPSCFALFAKTRECAMAAAAIRHDHPTWWVAPSRLL